jgi:LysM repeat protein
MKKLLVHPAAVVSMHILAGSLMLCSTGCRSVKMVAWRPQPPAPLLDSRGGVVPAPYSEPVTEVAAQPSPAPQDMNFVTPLEPALTTAPTDLPAVSAEAVMLPPVPEAETLTYTVKKGDTLWDIGKMYGVSHQELAAFNNMSLEDTLMVGKTLTIPPGGKYVEPEDRPTVKAAAAVESAVKPLPSDRKYTVEKGDNLWVIAKRFGVKVNDLRAVNSLSSDVLQPGQVLIIPDGSTSAAVKPPVQVVVSPQPEPGADSELAEPLPPMMGEEEPVPAATALPTLLDHTVVEGETLQDIADMYKLSVEALKEANPTIESDADLVPTMKIIIPFN